METEELIDLHDKYGERERGAFVCTCLLRHLIIGNKVIEVKPSTDKKGCKVCNENGN